MADNRITLTDVMRGLHKHDLINIMTEETWMFLTGLILYANERGFKNPIDLAIKQAINAGGGNSRQSVNRRRKALCNVKIDGKPILKVTAGKPGQKLVAKYDIDYISIVSYNGVWQGQNEPASQIYDGKRTVSGRTADDKRTEAVTFLRSEEKRGDKTTPQSPPNLVTTQESAETENGAGVVLNSSEEEEKPKMITMAKNLQDLILRKWRGQISKGPDIGACKQAIREYGFKLLVGAISQASSILNKQTPSGALNYVVAIARGMQKAGNGGVNPMLIAEREREISELSLDLAEAQKNPEKNAPWITQNEFLLKQKQAALQRLREG